jgi:hypothetical protein
MNTSPLIFNSPGIAHPILLRSEAEGYWTAIFRTPPGLSHGTRLRVSDGDWSVSAPVYLDWPVVPGRVEIVSASRSSASLVLWVRGMAENSDRNNVAVVVDGAAATIECVGKVRQGEWASAQTRIES